MEEQHEGGYSFAEYARLYHQEASLSAQLCQTSASVEDRIVGLHQAQHAIANLENERRHLATLTRRIEENNTGSPRLLADFVKDLHGCYERFEATWDLAIGRAQHSCGQSDRRDGREDLKRRPGGGDTVMASLQTGLGDAKLLAQKVVQHPEAMPLILAVVHASQGEQAVLGVSEEIALLCLDDKEGLLLSLMDTLQAHGSYITELGPKGALTWDPLSATRMVELELLEYLQSCAPTANGSHTPTSTPRRVPLHVAGSPPSVRNVSSPTSTLSSTLSSMSSSATHLWNSAIGASPPRPPLPSPHSTTEDISEDSSGDVSGDVSVDVQATASFTHEARQARDLLGSIAATSPRKRCVSMGSRMSDIRVGSPANVHTVANQQSATIQSAMSRLLAVLTGGEESNAARRFPIAIALCRRLLTHHFPIAEQPSAHRRVAILLVVRWFAFAQLGSLISRPDMFGRSLAGQGHSWAFGSLQFGHGSAFVKASVDHAKAAREVHDRGFMQGVWRGGNEVSLGELHRSIYSTITQAVEGAENEGAGLVSLFGVGLQPGVDACVQYFDGTVISTLSLTTQHLQTLWEVVGEGSWEREASGAEHSSKDGITVLYATNGSRSDGTLTLGTSLNAVVEHLADQQRDSSKDSFLMASTFSLLHRSVTSSSGWGSPPSSPMHQALDGKSNYFGNACSRGSPDGFAATDKLLRAGLDGVVGKGYTPSLLDGSEMNACSMLEDGRKRASDCFAFDDAALFSSTLARLPREGLDQRRMMKRVSQSRLDEVEKMKRRRERMDDFLGHIEQHRLTLIDRARLLYSRLQELRARSWYASEVRTSAVVVQAREAAQRELDGSGSDWGQDCAGWMQEAGIYNFDADRRLTSYLKALDPAFQRIASDAKSFFQAPIWKRESLAAQPFLMGQGVRQEGSMESNGVVVLTFGVCTAALLKPEDRRSSPLVALEDFLQRVQLLCTSLFLSEALHGVEMGDEGALERCASNDGDGETARLVEELKRDGAVDLLRRFRAHPSPRAKIQAILVLERLIVARLERPSVQQRRGQASRASFVSQEDARSIAPLGKPRRALSMYDDGGAPLSLQDALFAQPKAAADDGDAVTVRATSIASASRHATTDDVVAVLESLLRDGEVRPKNLFAILQIIAAFSPLQLLDMKDEGKAFWDLALASLSLRKEVAEAG